MAWTAVGTPILLKTDWQYTEPVTGSYFKFKHSSFPSNSPYELAQAQFNPDNSVELTDIQELHASPESRIICLKSIPVFNNRRIAIRRVAKQPSLGSEIRRVIRNDLLDDSSIESFVRRSAWTVAIESSDYVEPTTNTGSLEPTTQVIISDTFTAADETSLNSRSTDSGANWLIKSGQWLITNNKTYASSSATNLAYINAQSKVSINCDITWENSGQNKQQGLVIRCSSDANSYWILRYLYLQGYGSADFIGFDLLQSINGVETSMIKSTPRAAFPSGTTNKLKLVDDGQTIKGYLDAEEVISYASDSLNNNTFVGLYAYNSPFARYDNFNVLLT